MRAFQLSIPACNYMDDVINLKWENPHKLADIVALNSFHFDISNITVTLYPGISITARNQADY